MKSDYINTLNNIQQLHIIQEGEEYLQILSIVTEIMVQLANNQLPGATYNKDFLCGRLFLKIMVDKK